MSEFHEKSFAEAVNEGMHQAMEADPNVICYGLGVDDPKRIFGTTAGLLEAFGSERVFDMPTAENAMTGIAIGAAINGLKPVMTHQRQDFFLLAMDQLVNAAAKWFYMFGSQRPIPITIRLITGRGWGQGPTHSQNLHAWFAHIPGLKVLLPTTPEDAKGMTIAAINDPNPVLILEHRWLHNQTGRLPVQSYETPLDKARVVNEGSDLTIVGISIQTIEAQRTVKLLAEHGISVELIDLRSVQPIDWETVTDSVKKTGRLLVVDPGMEVCSVASEIVAHISRSLFDSLKGAPDMLTMPFLPEPTSYALTKGFHFGAQEIANRTHEMVTGESAGEKYAELGVQGHHDVPGAWFKGPF